MHCFLSLARDPTASGLPSTKGWDILVIIYFNLESSMTILLSSTCSVNTQVLNASSASGTVWDAEDTEMKAPHALAWSSHSSGKTGGNARSWWVFIRSELLPTKGLRGWERRDAQGQRGLGEPWRKCHPHRLQSCTSQRFGISIRAFYNGCFVPRVFLTHRHSSEHKTVWIDSTTFYWATVLRAFTRIISFGQFSVRPSRFLQKPGRQME